MIENIILIMNKIILTIMIILLSIFNCSNYVNIKDLNDHKTILLLTTILIQVLLICVEFLIWSLR
jgi:hypothetical protein